MQKYLVLQENEEIVTVVAKSDKAAMLKALEVLDVVILKLPKEKCSGKRSNDSQA